MSAFSRRVAELTGTAEARLERLAGGDLSEVLLIQRADGRTAVAKGGRAPGTEAAMLRAIRAAGVPAPTVEAEHDGVLLLDFVPSDGIFSPAAWRDIGEKVRQLHARHGEAYGWPVDYHLGTVELDNRQNSNWAAFWGEQRLVSAASLLDRPWRSRVDGLAARLDEMLPPSPQASLLHGDLWSGNILVADGRLAALIDPACYHGHAEVDLAMLTLFGEPPPEFWDSYGETEPGWADRRGVYQLFPAIVHLRLFGSGYAGMVDRLLGNLGF